MKTTPLAVEIPAGPQDEPGVEIERVSSSALEAISALFPGDRGLPFFAQLLSYAEVKQLVLPDGVSVDVGVVSLSLENFARRHQHSKDTALRYVAILDALGIVSRRRAELHIPLTPWQPHKSVLVALDRLITSARRKLSQLALSVKSRFLLLYGSCKRETFLDDISSTLADIQLYFSRSIGRAKRALLQKRVAHLQQRIQKGDFSQGSETSGLITSQIRDFSDVAAFHRSPSHSQIRDSLEGRLSAESSKSFKKGDFSLVGEVDQSSLTHQKEDREPDQASSVIQKGDFSQKSLLVANQKGDFSGVGASLIVNVNDTILLNDHSKRETVNVNDQAPSESPYTAKQAGPKGRELAEFLDTGLNVGGYVNKCKISTPTQVRAGVVAALVHTHFPSVDPGNLKGRPKSLGAWFHDFCNQALAGEPIPAYVRKWLMTDLSWKEIDSALLAARAKYTRYLFTDSESALLVRRWLWGEISEDSLEKALGITGEVARLDLVESQVPVAPPPVAKDWMDQAEAEALASEILSDGSRYGVTKTSVKPHGDHGASLVALTWGGVPMTMTSRHQWRTHFADVLPEFLARAKKEGRT